MKISHLAAGAALASMLAGAASADPLPMDTPVTLGSVEAVCTGVGSGKDDPRWKNYPVRVEFYNAAGQNLASAQVKLSDAAGQTMADFDCWGTWVLFKLPRGKYSVTATMDNMTIPPRSAAFAPPEHGQQRVILRFAEVPADK